MHNLWLTDRQVTSLCKTFAINSSKDIELSKSPIPKTIQLGGFLERLLGALLNVWLPSMKNVVTSLAKNELILLGLTTGALATDTWIHKNIKQRNERHRENSLWKSLTYW